MIPAAADWPAATLLGLLRAGEQSAAQAFARIARRLSNGELARVSSQLADLIADERRHEEALALHSAALPWVVAGDAATRRFFRGMESREPIVHLARVAALDACVCQVLSRVLCQANPAALGGSLTVLLSRIRADEARHVRVTRRLVRMLGADGGQAISVGGEVRHGFAALLGGQAAAFDALGVDSHDLMARIRRDG